MSRVSKVRIANITFAYKNAELIELLRKRGYAIKDGKWQEVNKTEAEINKKIRTPKHFKEYTRPRTAFVTFENEDSYEKALKF